MAGGREGACWLWAGKSSSGVGGDATPNDLVLGGDGLPLLGRREHRRGIHHGPVLKKDGAGGLQADDLNGQPAALVRHERQRDGLHAADILD